MKVLAPYPPRNRKRIRIPVTRDTRIEPEVDGGVDRIAATKSLGKHFRSALGKAMRGKLVALGIGLVFLGLTWWLALYVVGPLLPINPSPFEVLFYVCFVSIVLIVIGFMIFIAGVIGQSPAELQATIQYPPPPPNP